MLFVHSVQFLNYKRKINKDANVSQEAFVTEGFIVTASCVCSRARIRHHTIDLDLFQFFVHLVNNIHPTQMTSVG